MRYTLKCAKFQCREKRDTAYPGITQLQKGMVRKAIRLPDHEPAQVQVFTSCSKVVHHL